MNNISNFIMKKNYVIGGRPKRKSIPININTNPVPGKIFISSKINPITSSYLSMGQKIQTTKNLKNSKIPNSGINYFTLNNTSNLGNGSITNSLINNY